MYIIPLHIERTRHYLKNYVARRAGAVGRFFFLLKNKHFAMTNSSTHPKPSISKNSPIYTQHLCCGGRPVPLQRGFLSVTARVSPPEIQYTRTPQRRHVPTHSRAVELRMPHEGRPGRLEIAGQLPDGHNLLVPITPEPPPGPLVDVLPQAPATPVGR